MLRTQEIKDTNDLLSINISDPMSCKIPLFHGTRRYALQVTETDRNRFYEACNTVMRFAQELDFRDKIDKDELALYQRKTNPLFLEAAVYAFERCRSFEYGDLYLTTGFSTAFSYAHDAGGELGERAYRQCEGFNHFAIELDEHTLEAAKIVIEEYEKYRNSEKVILAYFGVKFTDLLHEGGSPFWRDDEEYMQEEIKYMYEDAIDTDYSQSNESFRLINPDKYMPYILPEKDFRKGFEFFTKIQDIDKFIEDHNIICSTKWEL
jgi:hypothetical protein